MNEITEKLSDLEIISLVKTGKTNVFSVLVKRHESKIAYTIFGILGNCQEAEDIGQEVFVRFFNSIDKFRGDAQLSTYLTRIAINLSLNELKRRTRRKTFSYEDWHDSVKTEEDNVKSFMNYEMKEIVQKALLQLEPKFRVVLVLRTLQGFSTEETAEILKMPKGTVLSRLSRAQQKIKQILEPYWEG